MNRTRRGGILQSPNDETYFLYGSSDARIGLSLKSAPEPDGVHLSNVGPCDVFPMIAP